MTNTFPDNMTFIDEDGEKRALSEANTGNYNFSEDVQWWLDDTNKQLGSFIK